MIDIRQKKRKKITKGEGTKHTKTKQGQKNTHTTSTRKIKQNYCNE